MTRESACDRRTERGRHAIDGHRNFCGVFSSWFEIGSRKRTDTTLRHDEIAGVRRNAFVDRSALALEEPLVLRRRFDGAQELVARARLPRDAAEGAVDLLVVDALLAGDDAVDAVGVGLPRRHVKRVGDGLVDRE